MRCPRSGGLIAMLLRPQGRANSKRQQSVAPERPYEWKRYRGMLAARRGRRSPRRSLSASPPSAEGVAHAQRASRAWCGDTVVCAPGPRARDVPGERDESGLHLHRAGRPARQRNERRASMISWPVSHRPLRRRSRPHHDVGQDDGGLRAPHPRARRAGTRPALHPGSARGVRPGRWPPGGGTEGPA